MVTKNFKAFMALILESSGQASSPCNTPLITTGGATVYTCGRITGFPYGVTNTISISSSVTEGVWIGTGSTAPTENDYTLESRITSGISATAPSVTYGVDVNGNPYKTMVFLLTNNTNTPITVSEIGFVQKLISTATQGATVSTTGNFLLDRTVLSTPVTVPANGSAGLEYTLKTVMS